MGREHVQLPLLVVSLLGGWEAGDGYGGDNWILFRSSLSTHESPIQGLMSPWFLWHCSQSAVPWWGLVPKS